MADLDVTSERLAQLAAALHRADAKARVLDQHFDGPLGAGGSPLTLDVGGAPIEIPVGASIRLRTEGLRPGIEINSDNEPAPPGTWLRIECAAVRQANELFAELAQIGAPEPRPQDDGVTGER